MDIEGLLADLRAEHEALDALVAGLDDAAWLTPTPAEGWDVRDSVSHICFFDETARLAATDPDAFAASTEALMAAIAEAGDTPDVALGRAASGPELLARWRASRAALLEALAAVPPKTRVPWYGPPMSVASFTTARIMETWAHGQDVVDALGGAPVPSPRLKHVIHIGVGARPYAFMVNGQEDPGDPVRVEAKAPDGDTWSWGPEDAADRVTGPALDLALVLTRRRHPDDTTIDVSGPIAEQWIAIAQTFAGPPGPIRAPGLGVAGA
jgi:uncharacterized protein (TIGR03084 family)